MGTPDGPLRPGSVLASRYRIKSQLGQGGFGLIYKARDLHRLNRLVAIKEISLAGLSPQEIIDATDTYNREVTLLSMLGHHSLPRLRDRFTDPEHWYLVMDYIKGETLEEILKHAPDGCLPPARVLDIGLALCDVLRYLHIQNPPIIFRDVKPANIMLTRGGLVYLIDFGIARQYRRGQNKDTGALGSPGYAAPEQYGRAQTTIQTDIYGLGATLQTLLTGKEPLDIAMEGIPPDHPIPESLQPLIAQMLERDPDLRPQSIEAVERQLTAINDNIVWSSHATGNAAFSLPPMPRLITILFFLSLLSFFVFALLQSGFTLVGGMPLLAIAFPIIVVIVILLILNIIDRKPWQAHRRQKKAPSAPLQQQVQRHP